MALGLVPYMLTAFFVSVEKQNERAFATGRLGSRAGGNIPLESKVIGGVYIGITRAPYQVSLQQEGKHKCGATIIGANWALCAAHCVADEKINEFKIHSGSCFRYIRGDYHKVTEIIVHKKYDYETDMFDIALIKVNKPFKTNSKRERAVELPEARSRPKEGTVVKVTGWGSILAKWVIPSLALKLLKLRIYNFDKCRATYAFVGVNVSNHMICAGHEKSGIDACQGDSGGPLVAGNVLVGIVSTGIGCGIRKYPGIYSDVGFFRKWIKKHTGI